MDKFASTVYLVVVKESINKWEGKFLPAFFGCEKRTRQSEVKSFNIASILLFPRFKKRKRENGNFFNSVGKSLIYFRIFKAKIVWCLVTWEFLLETCINVRVRLMIFMEKKLLLVMFLRFRVTRGKLFVSRKGT